MGHATPAHFRQQGCLLLSLLPGSSFLLSFFSSSCGKQLKAEGAQAKAFSGTIMLFWANLPRSAHWALGALGEYPLGLGRPGSGRNPDFRNPARLRARAQNGKVDTKRIKILTRLVYFLYFADAFHKAAGNTSLLISATWEIEHHRK